MLVFLTRFRHFTASALAREFCPECSVPESTFWHNLRSLHRKELLRFGHGRPVSLTEAGRLLAAFHASERMKIQNEGGEKNEIGENEKGGGVAPA